MAKLRRLARALPHWAKLRRLFDAAFYLRKYPDVARAGVDSFRHFVEHGAAEGRKPHALFDTGYYLLRCPEARQCGEPAVIHFLRRAGPACTSPHPLFDCESYARAHPEAMRENPLLHFVRQPRTEPPANALRLKILDAEIAIVFTDSAVAGAVSVWEDESGRMRFHAPPEQQPFFAALKYDQVRAQL